MKKFVSMLLVAMLCVAMCATLASAEDFSGVTVTYWTAPFGENDAAFFEEQLSDWMARTGAQVNIEVIPWDSYEEKYMTGVASGTGPDVGYMYNEMLFNYIDSGAILPIDEYFTDEEKAASIYWENGKVLGQQYLLPYVVGNPRILYVNMDLLAEAGLDAAPTTWDELVSTAKAIKEATGKTGFDQQWGGYFGDLNEVFFPYLWQAGGRLVDDEGNLFPDFDAALKAAEFLYSLKTEGVISEYCTSRDGSAIAEDFRNGDIGMAIMSTSAAAKNTEAGINWGFAPYTTETAGGTFVANDSLVLMSSAKNVEAAISLMKEITSIPVMEAFHEQVYQMPPISEGEKYLDNPAFETMYEEAASGFHALPVVANF
ncbi:MAG: extracellular solute-binding protein [Clostridia bacterium]|nr:extracellular solute-binding protein [Clostridia bacterium]